MGKVILICGRIGAGKTTYAAELIRQTNAVNISQDELMLALFGPGLYERDPQKYGEYCMVVEDYVKRKAGEAAKAGAVVICENGFWSRAERDELKKFYAGMGVSCELHYIDTPQGRRIENINKRNGEIKRGKQHFFLTSEVDINHFFEAPDDDEIDFKVTWENSK